MVEAENPALEGRSEAAPSELEGAKEEARTRLLEGASVEQVIEESGLSRPVVLGLLGAIRKKAKRLSKSEGEPSENLEEENLVSDLRDEAKLTGAAVTLARNQNRLKAVAPGLYDALHGSGQSEANSPGKVLADLELAKYIKQMREQEAGHQNNGDSQGLQKQINDLKEEMHKKDVEALKKETEKLEGQIIELRADLRTSTNSNSDLATVVREGKDLIVKALETQGPIRSYLIPSESYLRKPSDAPLLAHAQEPTGSGALISGLAHYGLVTRAAPKVGS